MGWTGSEPHPSPRIILLSVRAAGTCYVVYMKGAIHQSEEDRNLCSREPCSPGLLGSPGACHAPQALPTGTVLRFISGCFDFAVAIVLIGFSVCEVQSAFISF